MERWRVNLVPPPSKEFESSYSGMVYTMIHNFYTGKSWWKIQSSVYWNSCSSLSLHGTEILCVSFLASHLNDHIHSISRIVCNIKLGSCFLIYLPPMSLCSTPLYVLSSKHKAFSILNQFISCLTDPIEGSCRYIVFPSCALYMMKTIPPIQAYFAFSHFTAWICWHNFMCSHWMPCPL